jgi:nucleoside-diphosphate-sugar epimerase/fructoselysine-6-P-deglycase FrlB-like protein
MIGARRGSPLAIGFGEGEMFLGSDAMALAPYTNRICYLEEDDWAVVTRDGASIFNRGKRVNREVRETALSGALVGKGNFRHFMMKEIAEQPSVIGDTLQAFVDPLNRRIELPPLPVDLKSLNRLTIVACGTAYLAGYVAKYWLEGIARLPVDLDFASEFRYRQPPLDPDGATLASRNRARRPTPWPPFYAKAAGHRIVAVLNQPESTIGRESDAILHTLAGPEIGVASTKAFSTQLVVLAALALAAARARGHLDPAREARLSAALLEVPARAAEILNHDERLRAIAQRLAIARCALPDATVYPIALEGALSSGNLHIHADYAAGNEHGPIALRRGRAGDRGGAFGRVVREDRLQPAGSPCQGRARHLPVRQGGHCPAWRARRRGHRASRRRSLRGAHPLCHTGAASGLSRSRRQGHGRRSAAEPRQERHGRIGKAAARAAKQTEGTDMLILVTGATGKVGQHFLGRLFDDPRFTGWQVRALCHNRVPPPRDRLSVLKGSIAERDVIEEAMAGVTHVLHLATCKETPEDVMDVTVKGLFWLLEAYRSNPTARRFILIGGDAAIGHFDYRFPEPITEAVPHMAYPGCYALSKVLEEVMVRQYCIQYGIDGCCLRAPWIMEKDDFKFTLSFGTDVFGGPAWKDLVPEADAARYRDSGTVPLLLDADGRPLKRSFVHVDDLVSAILIALDHPRARQQLFNIGTDEPVDYGEVAAYLKATRGIDAADPAPPQQPA